MAKKPANHEKALVAVEIALVGLLCWAVLSSQSGSTVRASNQDVQQKALKKKDKQERRERRERREKRRYAPTEGVPEPASSRLVAAAGTTVACTTFDFAGGSAQGFTVQPVFGTPLALWHLTNNLCRALLGGHSTPFTFYYGQDATCNYNTGARNAANLISPPISLAGKFAPFTVNFNYLLFVEGGGFDTTFVDISTDNGATWTQILSKANLINDNQWHNVSTNVTAFVGAATSVRLRFRFDSIDNIANSTTGWHVDDISVCGEAFNFCVQSDSGDNILRFNSITGAYQFMQCSSGFTSQGTGVVTASGCSLTLQDNTFDHFVTVNVDTCAHTGNATLHYLTPPRKVTSFTISDSNTLNNTCACP